MILQFKKDIKFPLGENKGYLLFPRTEYRGLVMLDNVNNATKSFTVKIGIVNKESKAYTGHNVVNNLVVTTEGFNGTMLNQTDYDAYISEVQNLKDQIETLSIEITAKRKQIKQEAAKENPDQGVISTLSEESRTLRKQLAPLALELEGKRENPVLPDYEKVDKYDDIKTLFNNFEVGAGAFDFLKRQIKNLEEYVTLPTP